MRALGAFCGGEMGDFFQLSMRFFVAVVPIILRTEWTVSILWRLAECLFWIGRAAASFVCLWIMARI